MTTPLWESCSGSGPFCTLLPSSPTATPRTMTPRTGCRWTGPLAGSRPSECSAPHPRSSRMAGTGPSSWPEMMVSGEPSLVPGLPNPSCPRAESRALHSADLQGGWGLHRGQGPTRPLPPAASPPSTATGTLSIEILEVNDHAPELSPPWGSLCSTPDRGSGLLLGATDEDLPPHGAPFHFQLSPRVPELARNWSLSQVNGEPHTHTPGVQSLGEVPAGATSVHPQARQGLVIRLRGRMGKPRPSMPGAPTSRLLPVHGHREVRPPPAPA